MEVAAEILMTIAADPKHPRATIGVTLVLHIERNYPFTACGSRVGH